MLCMLKYAKSTGFKGFFTAFLLFLEHFCYHKYKEYLQHTRLKPDWEWRIPFATTKIPFPVNNSSRVTQCKNEKKLIYSIYILLTLAAK